MEMPIGFDPQHWEILKNTARGARNLQDVYPLSSLQEGILFQHALDPRHDTYLLSVLFELDSHAHVVRLTEALDRVIERHEALRSAIVWEKLPRPLQVVFRRAPLEVGPIELASGRDPVQQLKELMRLGREGLDLARAPLMWLGVAPDPDGVRWYALLQIHHIVCDHLSWDRVIGEALSLLAGKRELPPPVEYRAYVEWAREHEPTRDAEAFFRGKLAGMEDTAQPFGLSLVPGDVGPIDEARGGVPHELAQRIRIQAKRLGVGAARLFHAAWGLVVARASGRDDVVFGTVLSTAYRKSAREQPMVGLFINTLPIRLRIAGLTVAELLKQVELELADVLNHDRVPLTVAQKSGAGVGAVSPFTAVLNYRYSSNHSVVDAGAGTRDESGARVIAYQGARGYPLALTVDNFGERFSLIVQARRPVDPARVLGYVCTALESITEALERAPETTIRKLPVLPRAEWHDVVHAFNAHSAGRAQERQVHHLFEDQVARHPDSIAVECDGRKLTYLELDRAANRVAHSLRQLGARPGQRVGVCLERGIPLVSSFLGILKAGASYVPLDPDHPGDRLSYMLEDSAPRVLITRQELRGIWSALPPDLSLLYAEDPLLMPDSRDDVSTVDSAVQPHDLAYVIYTSGSTGKPKGVMVEHRHIATQLLVMQAQLDVRPGDVFPSLASSAFDASVLELLLPLVSGARALLLRSEHVKDLGELTRRTAAATHLLAVPSLMEGWLGYMGPEAAATRYPALRVLMVGGEAVPRNLLQRMMAHFPHADVVELYGPTEATIVSTFYAVTPNDLHEVSHCIGRPFAHSRAYVLDRECNPQPIGAPGELYLGGSCIARGYLNRADLTAERFVHDPFSDEPDARMYRTGDVARWLPDGNLEYLGRNDRQVKIRGHRIEPEEIEAVLSQHPQVKEAAVVARQDVQGGQKRLVAYVRPSFPNAGARLSAPELRQFLHARLPEYMVPTAFVQLSEFPRNANGKLDRGALPAPEGEAFALATYEEPQGAIEQALAQVWQELLQVPRVGRQDNFFQLGGDSLLGMKLFGRIGETLNMTPPVVSIFRHPTVSEMAALIETLLSQNAVPVSHPEAGLERGVI